MPVVVAVSRKSIAHGVARASASILLVVATAFAAEPPLSPERTTISSYRDPIELVRKAVANEIKASEDGAAHFLFRGTKTTPKGSTTELYVEAKDATAGLVIAYNGKPLTAEQHRDEETRVERFIDNPEEMKKKRQQEHENSERTTRIVRALPDAFLYEYDGEEKRSEGMGRVGGPLIKLRFRPNPAYKPPSRVEEVLTAMQGYVLMDAARARLARIDGTLFKEVGFGWGILGHLDRGGRFEVQQQEVGDNLWEISSMSMSFTGKILLVKSISVVSTEVFTGFKQVPADLTFAQALELMKKEYSSGAGNSAADKLARQ